jgi:hypothetical protein
MSRRHSAEAQKAAKDCLGLEDADGTPQATVLTPVCMWMEAGVFKRERERERQRVCVCVLQTLTRPRIGGAISLLALHYREQNRDVKESKPGCGCGYRQGTMTEG